MPFIQRAKSNLQSLGNKVPQNEKALGKSILDAALDSISGTIADQWLEFFAPKDNLSPTVGLSKAQKRIKNRDRGHNTFGNDNIITNGSKVILPEGYALITTQDGAITGVITEPGLYEYTTDNLHSQSVFTSDDKFGILIRQAFDKFKYAGIPASEQLLFYINLKEIPRNKFGTQSVIYWDDYYINAQVGAMVRGTYTLQITNPVLFIRQFVPLNYLNRNASDFDFDDMDNVNVEQLFTEVVSSLSSAFSLYANADDKEHRITKIQSDQVGFARSLSQVVERDYAWETDRGLSIVKVAIVSLEYDEESKALLKQVKEADAMGARGRGNTFMQMSVARGIENAGNNGGQGLAFMGMGMGSASNMMNSMYMNNNQTQSPFNNQGMPNQGQYAQGMPNQGQYNQGMPNQGQYTQGVPNQGQYTQGMPNQAQYNNGAFNQANVAEEAQATPQGTAASVPNAQAGAKSVTEQLVEAKQLVDLGILSPEEFDALKKKLLNL